MNGTNGNDLPPTRIRYNYDIAPEARLQTAHGVWGGINGQGEIEMNFYNESDTLPAYTEQLIAPDGTLGHEIVPGENDPQRMVVRNIHSRILLNYNTARAIVEWLEGQLEVLETEGPPEIFPGDSGIRQ